MNEQLHTLYCKPNYQSNYGSVTSTFKPICKKGVKILELSLKATGKWKEETGKVKNRTTFDESLIKWCATNIPNLTFVCSENSPEVRRWNNNERIEFSTTETVDLGQIKDILNRV